MDISISSLIYDLYIDFVNSITFTRVILYLILFYLLRVYFKNLHLPPGPYGLPFLGCLLGFKGDESPHRWYLRLAKRYGGLMSLWLGSHLVVCVSNPKLIKKLFLRPDSTDRPKTPLNNLLEGRGIVLSEGTLWKQQRLFLLEKFRALGVTMWKDPGFQKCIQAEIGEFLSDLTETEGKILDPFSVFGRHIHNVICQLMMSFRFESSDPEFVKFNDTVARGMKYFGAVHIGEHIPMYVKLPGKQVILNKIKANLVDVSSFHARHLSQRRMERMMNIRHNPVPEDLLDFFIDQIELERNEPAAETTIFPGVDKDKQIIQVMNDLFSAGMETSRTTLLWAVLVMVREPHVAKKVREQLAAVVGRNQRVTMEHRAKLPYVEACIYEVLRRLSVVPLGTTHVNQEAWKIKGYRIPQGSHIVPLINKVNMDPEYFPDPEKFDPERFVVKGGVSLPEAYLAFGVGRRQCLGEKLAKMELFLFFANLMNHFSFDVPPGDEVPGYEGPVTVTHAPKPFNLIFTQLTSDPN